MSSVVNFSICTALLTYFTLTRPPRELREYCPEIPCILVANKIDVDYQVTKKNFKFASQHNLPFFFVSAADGTNVVKIFDEAIREGVQYKINGKTDFVTECLELFDDSPLAAADSGGGDGKNGHK